MQRCRQNGKQCRPGLGAVRLEEQSDLGLQCMLRPVCPKTKDHYGIMIFYSSVCVPEEHPDIPTDM